MVLWLLPNCGVGRNGGTNIPEGIDKRNRPKLLSVTAPYCYFENSWSSYNAFVSAAKGLRFKSQAGQIEHSDANGSPQRRHFFQKSCVAYKRIEAEMVLLKA